MSYKGRVALVLVLAIAFSLVLVWMVFHKQAAQSLWENPLAIGAILILCVAPIYPLYRTLRRRTATSAVATLLLMGALISGLAYLIGSLILRLDTTWVNAAYTLSTGMVIASCVLFIWNGFVRKKGSPK
jgi:hypothetical protein